MLSREFLEEFRRQTETRWREETLDPRVYGFQFQAGSRWLPGLSDEQILAFENDVSIRFTTDFKMLLSSMNGTDLPTLNIYGSSGEPARWGVGVYSYPRDLQLVRQLISEISESRETLRATLAAEGFYLSATAKLMPVYAHRFVVCDDAQPDCPVLSIWDSEDAIVYGATLREYLSREFLGESKD